MYNEKIEALIKAALADGVLTEKEKQILFKNAQAQGIDLDEFEMVLDAKLVELQKAEKEKAEKSAPKSNKFGDVRKCPACGAIISSGMATCQECGYAFTEATAIASREKLYSMLEEIDKQYIEDDRPATDIKGMLANTFGNRLGRQTETKKSTKLKASAITNFAIPNTRADLLDFCSFLVVLANPAAPKDYKSLSLTGANEDLGYAYWLLFSSCITKAKISFANDDSFTPFYEKYQEMLGESKKFRLSRTAKIVIGFVVFYIVLFSILGIFWDKIK